MNQTDQLEGNYIDLLNFEKNILNQMIYDSSSKHFSKEDSEIIMRVVEGCYGGRKTVNWTKVYQIFGLDHYQESLMKKIKNHYYNLRSRDVRKLTKKNSHRLVLLGLDITD